MPSVSIKEAGSAAGHGTRDGTSVTGGGTSMDKPFVLQWYWQESVMHPYERTKAWYYGPREKWMKLYVERKRNKRIKKTQQG
jgi:hypothetical protein